MRRGGEIFGRWESYLGRLLSNWCPLLSNRVSITRAVHSLEEAGQTGARVRQAAEVVAMLRKYPPAVFEEPDYESFPYAP